MLSDRKGRTWIGLDIDDQSIHGYSLDEEGEIRDKRRMSTPKLEVVHWLRELPSPRYVMFEECALAQWLYDNLVEEVEDLVVCEPKENAWINRSNKKSDQRDAYRLAKLRRLGEYKAVYHTTDTERVELRRQVKHYHMLTREVARWKNRLKSRFKGYGIFTNRGLYKPEKRKEWQDRLPKGACRKRIERELEILDLIQHQKDTAQRSMIAYARRFPEVRRIQDIPGFGPVAAPSFVGIIMEPNRFNDRHAFWRYCRMGITSGESAGKKIRPDCLDIWNGHGILKNLSRTAFIAALKTDSVFNRYYRLKCHTASADYKARLTTQRKILTSAWQVWLKGEEFDAKKVI